MVFMSFFQINYVGKGYQNVPLGASCTYLFRLFLRNGTGKTEKQGQLTLSLSSKDFHNESLWEYPSLKKEGLIYFFDSSKK